MPARRSRPALTRRHFLGHLGAIGGSSLVMTAMTSWELMAGQAGERPSLAGRPREAKVLILGAGLSGLVLGYELGKLGYDFRILEARDRVGGLAWTVRRGSEHTEVGADLSTRRDGAASLGTGGPSTRPDNAGSLGTGERQVCTFDEGQHVNVGAWRIPYTHTGILNYCKELGVALQIFVNESDASYFYYEGAGALSNRRVRLREIKADLIGHTNELLVKAIDQRSLDLPLTDDDRQRFVDFLIAQGFLDSSDHRYKAFAHRGPGDPYAFAELLRSGFGSRMRSIPLRDGTQSAPMFHPIGGMDRIAVAFQRAIGPAHLTLNADVQSVHQDDRGVKVVYVNTKSGAKTEVAADYVVVCMPFSVLAGVDINLSPDMMAAVKATTYSNSAKVGLAMKRRFWEEDDQIFGGHLYSNLPLGEFSYPSSDYFAKKGVLLGLYANGPIGDLLDQSVRARVEHVLTHASKVHPQIRDEFESGYAVWWKKVKYNLGGFASGAPPARRAQFAKVDNRIILGSAATAPYSEPDWQEGAVAAAWQALTSLHNRAMRA
jgi:monoamine oxidase